MFLILLQAQVQHVRANFLSSRLIRSSVYWDFDVDVVVETGVW